jgi:methyl-accepting chemotaxis protein
MAQLSDSNARIARRVQDVRSLTEREVLACGTVLQTIVEKARDLANESERTLASSTARSEEITSRFILGMQEDILAQETAVRRTMDLASGIAEAIAALDHLVFFSKILAINAKIEAARLGSQGDAFEVVADGLGGLSDVIGEASDKVTSAIGAVREGLPPVSARAASMRERSRLFVNEVAERVRSASLHVDNGSSNDRLDVLMELSNQALSHLQFQDPMAQKLLLIDRDLDLVKDRVRRVLNGVDHAEVSEIDEESSSEPLPGEVVLF